MANSHNIEPVKVLNVSSKTSRSGLARFDILIEAVNIGECFLDFRCSRPGKVHQAVLLYWCK